MDTEAIKMPSQVSPQTRTFQLGEPNIYVLKSVHGGRLCASVSDQLIQAVPGAVAPDSTVLLIRSRTCSLAILVRSGRSVRALAIGDPRYEREFHLASTRAVTDSSHMVVTLLGTRTCLTALPFGPDQDIALIACNRTEAKEWEVFHAELLQEPAPVPDHVVQCVAWLDRHVCDGRVSLAAVTTLIEEDTLAPHTGEFLHVLLAMLSRDDMHALGLASLNPAISRRLAQLLPADMWARRALPDLIEWSTARHRQDGYPDNASLLLRPPVRAIGTDLDPLALAGADGHFLSAGHAINAYARRSITPRKRSCVVTTVRNEGVYLLEWVAYYRKLGFDHLFVYSNNNDDGSDAILHALAVSGLITWIDSTVAAGADAQGKAYGHAFGVLPDVLDYEWCLVVDLDEYLVLDADHFASVGHFLDWHETRQVDAIGFNWIMLGSSGLIQWEDRPVTRRFMNKSAIAVHIKTMFRPAKVIQSHPHYPVTDYRSHLVFRESDGTQHLGVADESGRHELSFSTRPQADFACIYHFFYKSVEEFLWKFSRNRGNFPRSHGDIVLSLPAEFLNGFLAQHIDPPGDAARIVAGSRNLEADIATILSLPMVKAAHERVCETFAIRSGRVRAFYRTILADHFGEDGARLLAELERGFG